MTLIQFYENKCSSKKNNVLNMWERQVENETQQTINKIQSFILTFSYNFFNIK